MIIEASLVRREARVSGPENENRVEGAARHGTGTALKVGERLLMREPAAALPLTRQRVEIAEVGAPLEGTEGLEVPRNPTTRAGTGAGIHVGPPARLATRATSDGGVVTKEAVT